MAEAVPPRGAFKSTGELRYDVAIPQQHPVHRLAAGDQLGGALGVDDPVDERIDRRILDADVVSRADPVGRLGAEIVALLVTGRERLRPQRNDENARSTSR